MSEIRSESGQVRSRGYSIPRFLTMGGSFPLYLRIQSDPARIRPNPATVENQAQMAGLADWLAPSICVNATPIHPA